MTLAQEHFQKQENQLAALREELSRLNAQFDAQMKDLGLEHEDLVQAESMSSPELTTMLRAAREGAKRAGSARAAQAALATQPAGHAPGKGRAGVIRL